MRLSVSLLLLDEKWEAQDTETGNRAVDKSNNKGQWNQVSMLFKISYGSYFIRKNKVNSLVLKTTMF